jgi:hypothetical protein
MEQVVFLVKSPSGLSSTCDVCPIRAWDWTFQITGSTRGVLSKMFGEYGTVRNSVIRRRGQIVLGCSGARCSGVYMYRGKKREV